MIAYREYQNSTAMDQDLSCYTENLKLTTTAARSSDSNDSFRFVNKSFRLPDRNIETIWIMHWSLMKPWQVWRLSVNKHVHFSAWIMRISFMLFLKLESSDLHSLFFEWKRTTSTAFKIYYFVFHIRKKFIQVCTNVRMSKQTQFSFLGETIIEFIWPLLHRLLKTFSLFKVKMRSFLLFKALSHISATQHLPTVSCSNSSEAPGRGEQTISRKTRGEEDRNPPLSFGHLSHPSSI